MIHPELGPITSGFKPLPNHYVRERLIDLCVGSYLDGELYSIDQNGAALFNRTQSDMMSHGGEPDFRFAAFDCFERIDWEFVNRYHHVATRICSIGNPRIRMLTHTLIGSTEEFLDYFEACLKDGYEGVVVRALAGPYKSGRSTFNQGWMLKYKPWEDAEGTIIGFEELYHNENPKEVGRTGLSQRSSHVEGKVPGGTLGALVLKTEWGILRVGTGFDATTRQEIWDRNCELITFPEGASIQLDLGRKVSFKYLAHGMKDLPRHPIYKGFRED
jgi:DNA ligase-1